MSNMLAQSNLYFCSAREFAIGGHCKMILANLRGSTAYETGGVLVDSQLVGAGTKGKIAYIGSVMSDSGTYHVKMKRDDIDTVRLVWFVTATGAEVANATDLDAETLTTPIIFIP
jgi:hypothetical protein